MLSISDFLVCTFSSQVVQFPNLLQFIWSGNFFYIWSWEAISCTNCPLTWSAQVCRIAYELMQQHHVDASDRFKSLDDIWWVLRTNHWSYSFFMQVERSMPTNVVQVLWWSRRAPTRGGAAPRGWGEEWRDLSWGWRRPWGGGQPLEWIQQREKS